MTPTQQLAELKLGVPLSAWVGRRRSRGDSWQTIARELYTATDLSVSDETIRLWFAEAQS